MLAKTALFLVAHVAIVAATVEIGTAAHDAPALVVASQTAAL